MNKKLLTLITLLVFSICTISISFAGSVTETITTQKNITDQFTPQQDGKSTDLNDNKDIPENVKNRIKELSDTKPETKTGTVMPEVLRPSVNRQK